MAKTLLVESAKETKTTLHGGIQVIQGGEQQFNSLKWLVLPS